MVDGNFPPFLFGYVDHFGDGLTCGYGLGLTLQNRGRQPYSGLCAEPVSGFHIPLQISLMKTRESIKSDPLRMQGIQGSERFTDLSSVTQL